MKPKRKRKAIPDEALIQQNYLIDTWQNCPSTEPQSELRQHQETFASYFRQHPLKTLAQAAAKIEELTGIRSREQVRVFLKSLGMECR